VKSENDEVYIEPPPSYKVSKKREGRKAREWTSIQWWDLERGDLSVKLM
jgi:hypothetical protein